MHDFGRKKKLVFTVLPVICICILLAGQIFKHGSRRPASDPLPGYDMGSDSVWTQWYNHPKFFALQVLLSIRANLDAHNLFNTYSHNIYPNPPTCSISESKFRSADGSCTDLKNPSAGAANIRFGRNVPLTFTYPNEEELLSPNPRKISLELLSRENGIQEVPFLNLLAAAWIQFEVHDWFSHGDNQPNTADFHPHLLPLPTDDPLRSAPFNLTELIVPRVAMDSSRTEAESRDAPTYLNKNTAWWDGSQIYGNDQQTQDRLREHVAGRMRIDRNGRLPLSSEGKEDTGFNKNWWVGLSLLHHLFVLEHNQIAAQLAAHHRDWSDEQIFQTARLVNAAVMAKIHTVEWTPAILANPILKTAMSANWYGLTNIIRDNVRFLKYIIPDPNITGLIGDKQNDQGVPYSLTEEFVSVYRLHSLLPDEIHVRERYKERDLATIALNSTREQYVHPLLDTYGVSNLLYSFGHQHPGALTLNNFPKTLQAIQVPLMGLVDMGSIDILRDRERGVPRYNEFRQLIGLKRVPSFQELNSDPKVVAKLQSIYGSSPGDIDKLDLLVGTLAESTRPTGFGFGETQFQIFILMASRRLQADRFFTDDFTEKAYSKEGMDWIGKASMKQVLIRNYPELTQALSQMKEDEAFNPWKN